MSKNKSTSSETVKIENKENSLEIQNIEQESIIISNELKEDKANLFAQLANFFVDNYRITVSLFLFLIIGGILAYNTFLPKEGFPPIQIKNTIISTSIIVEDPQEVDNQVTIPIEEAVSNIENITSISSLTTANKSSITVFWEEDVDIKQSSQDLEQTIKNNVKLPEGAEIEFIQPDANKFLNQYDALVGLYNINNQSLADIQLQAEDFANFVVENDNISDAEIIPLVEDRIDPVTGNSFEFQESFNRVGVKKDDQIIYYDTVQIGIIKESEIDALELSDAINEQIDKYKSETDISNYEFIMQGDNAVNIRNDLDNLQESIAIGMFFALVVVLVLISWKAGILIALFIPVVMAVVFLRLWSLELTLNTVSFFGLIIALGLFVDDATVVVESIYTYRIQGKNNKEAIKHAINEVGMSSLVGSLTTILVFAPMIFVKGILGTFITDLPISVIVSLVASFLLSLTFIPFVSNIVLGKNSELKTIDKETRKRSFITPGEVIDIAGKFTAGIIFKIQNSKKRTILTLVSIFIFVIAIFGLGFYYLQSIPFDIFADQKDSNKIVLTIKYPEKTNIQTAQEIAKDVEQTLSNELGDNLQSLSYTSGNQRTTSMTIDIKPMEERSQTASEIVTNLNTIFDSEERADVSLEVRGSASGSSASDDFTFSLNVQGNNKEAVVNTAKEIEIFIKDLEISGTGGQKVLDTKLENVTNISKLDQTPYVVVKAVLTDDTTGTTTSLREQIEDEFNEEKLLSLGLEEQALEEDPNSTDAQFNRSLLSLVTNFAVALVIMYLLLMVLYKSFSQPFLIFLAPLFSLPGVFVGLALTDNALGFFPILGLLGLFGIAVNNTIMIVDGANSERQAGKTILESISKAIQTRFRPVITTSLTTIAALSVMLSDPFWQSLAVTMIFGLISSVFLVLFAFPYFYIAIEWLRKKKNETFTWLK